MTSWRSSVVWRKGRRYAAVPLRTAINLMSRGTATRPPIVADSVPKSGTHLLVQIVNTLPGTRDWGLFLATLPSFRFRELPAERLARRVSRMADGELAGAHLHWDPVIARAMADRGVAHYFIYRDPRDVVVSEAHYLARMNRWHRLHRHFRTLPDMQIRIRLAITGLPAESGLDYPSIETRYARYLGWLDEPGTCAVRYEQLAGPDREQAVRRIVEHWAGRSQCQESIARLVSIAMHAIEPAKSHTFRKGVVGGWREAMDPKTLECFHHHGSGLLARLGYDSAAP